MNNEITDKKLINYIINHYIDMRKLLHKLGIDVKSNNSMFCPFHINQNTPAAHLYKEEDGSYRIWCYSEDRMFGNVDLYRNFLPEIKLEDLANLLFNNLSDKEKEKIYDNVNRQYELPELPYNNLLEDFKNNKITYKALLQGINMTIPQDDTLKLINIVYSLGDPNAKLKDSNKYIYFMNHYKSDYRFVSASKLMINCSTALPTYIKDYLKYSGDSIMLPNKINDTVYSITFRNINGPKQFIKMGQTSHLFYNMGNLPEDFVYGTPIILVEGNMDCDSISQIYPYTLATLTNSLSLNQLQLLSHLTNKVIVAYDNDEAGNKGYWSVYNSLTKIDFIVKRFRHSHQLKDFGDLIDLKMKDNEEYEYISTLYKMQINNLLSEL